MSGDQRLESAKAFQEQRPPFSQLTRSRTMRGGALGQDGGFLRSPHAAQPVVRVAKDYAAHAIFADPRPSEKPSRARTRASVRCTSSNGIRFIVFQGTA